MGYYATGTGTLGLQEGVGEIDLGETMSSWDEGWEAEQYDDVVRLDFDAKYRFDVNPGVRQELATLARFVEDGQYVTFTGESHGDVWRVVFAAGDVVEISPVWPEVATT